MTASRSGRGQNPKLIAQTVKRMVWALSQGKENECDDEQTAVLVAIAWRADHKTGQASLTDDEVARDFLLISPLIPSQTRFC